MKAKLKKTKQLIAIIVAALLILTAVPFAVFSIQSGGDKTEDRAAASYSEEDLKTASDISNMTGVKTEDILAMREEGKTWNEILDALKNNKIKGNQGERSKLLSQSGLGDSYVEDLKKEGFSDNEITDAKLIAERVLFNLNEIVSAVNLQNPVTPLPADTGTTADDSAYTELAGKFDLPTAVMLMLRLKDDFGGTEQVLNEYLFSLQAGLELNEYIQDKILYKKQRDEKSQITDQTEIITVQKIEEKMLETIQNANKANTDAAIPGTLPAQTQNGIDISKGSVSNPLPSDILPEGGKAVRPENPTQKLMDEIKELNPDID